MLAPYITQYSNIKYLYVPIYVFHGKEKKVKDQALTVLSLHFGQSERMDYYQKSVRLHCLLFNPKIMDIL